MTVLVGADPEVFVRNQKGQFRSAHGLIPGTKREPYPVADGAVQVDGMALEFNINPADTREKFISNIGSVLGQMAAMVPDYQITIQPTARFHWAHMKKQPKEALELGCEPDYDAYREAQNPRPDGAKTMRTAAGHVHIGFIDGADVKSEEHMQRCYLLAKTCDLFLGIPSLLWDSDNKRRQMYGNAGAFRPKPYGMEYRTLSNAWLKDERLVGFIFDATQRAVDFLKAGNRINQVDMGCIQRDINNGRLPAYRQRGLIDRYGLVLAPEIEE
jgi:hypothetical protein